ncbi:hypothetical protein V5799_000274 [Amblyomma americanum]|uniref:Secreted protein n=1 Tax=Amblyomma americanum TaxID=6943 RepID=A0AAQ4D3I4_AMBAM
MQPLRMTPTGYSLVTIIMALNLTLCYAAPKTKQAPRSVKEACGEQKPLLWSNGFRYVEQFPAALRGSVLKCLSTNPTAAKQLDTQLDAYRQEALKAILPKGTPPDKLSQTVCEITMTPIDGTNEVVKRKSVPSLDIKAIQAKCLKCAFPKLSEADALARYKEVVKTFESYEDNAVRVTSELEAAMRYVLDEGPTKEMNDAARTMCLKTMAPGVASNQYMTHAVSLFKKGDLETKKKIDACTYKNSLKGKWVRARQMMIRECALEAQKKLSANLQGDLQFLYALHLNTTALDIYLSCAEHEEDTIVDGPTGPGGPVDVYCTSQGRPPRKCPQCAAEVYTTVDAGKVEAAVDACYSKKEAAHPLYKEYTGYLGRLQATDNDKTKCLQGVLGAQRAAAIPASQGGKSAKKG